MLFDSDGAEDLHCDYRQDDDLVAFLCEQPDWFIGNVADRLAHSMRGREILALLRKGGRLSHLR